jgi:hypothetical protein
MFLHLILITVAMLTGAFTAVLGLLILGIHRGDRGKRLTGEPGSRSTRRRASDQDYQPYRCRLFRPPLPRHRLSEMPCPVPLDTAQVMAFPQEPQRRNHSRKR